MTRMSPGKVVVGSEDDFRGASVTKCLTAPGRAPFAVTIASMRGSFQGGNKSSNLQQSLERERGNGFADTKTGRWEDFDLAQTSTKAPDPMDIALGAAVRIRRRTIGISQEALAEQCGVSFQQIQKYENGANRISFSRLVQIARALKCRVVDLMDVLDGPDRETTGDLDLLTRMRTPGAVELLAAFEEMAPEARSALVTLLRAVTPPVAVEANERQVA
jgi:transcriptional regulator with XRE-family HTH domain